MNVYDFDKTIYAGDSTIDFYLFCLKKYPYTATCLLKQMQGLFMFAAGKEDIRAMKEHFFSFLPGLKDPQTAIELFWKINRKKIKKWYLENKSETDLIISASPYFLIAPVCEELGIQRPIATLVDIHSGKITGQNCKGKEKVRRFYEQYAEGEIETFYSDSLVDTPLANIARKSVWVRGDTLCPWPEAEEQRK